MSHIYSAIRSDGQEVALYHDDRNDNYAVTLRYSTGGMRRIIETTPDLRTGYAAYNAAFNTNI